MLKKLTLMLGLLFPVFSGAQEKPIVLTPDNTVTLRGPVTEDSMSKLKLNILDKYHALFKPKKIYLVLDTPGGDVIAGDKFIDFAKSLDVEIHTITIFAASMGYHIVQNLDNRYVMDSSILMSHRATLGLQGELNGEFDVRLNFFRKVINRLDKRISDRMQMDFESYKNLISDEFWVSGQDAVNYRSADKLNHVVCSKKMDGTVDTEVNTLFGKMLVTFHECPLITAPISTDFANISNPEVREAFYMLYYDKVSFVDKYITNSHNYAKFKTWLKIGH